MSYIMCLCMIYYYIYGRWYKINECIMCTIIMDNIYTHIEEEECAYMYSILLCV